MPMHIWCAGQVAKLSCFECKALVSASTMASLPHTRVCILLHMRAVSSTGAVEQCLSQVSSVRIMSMPVHFF